MMQLLAVPWDACQAPCTIQQVWDYLSRKIREEKEHLRHSVEEFYGKSERMAFISSVNDALKVCIDVSDHIERVGTYLELEALLNMDKKEVGKVNQVQEYLELLKNFSEKTKLGLAKLAQTRCNLEENIVQHLEKYCSQYTRLGIADDEFYKSLKAKTASVKDTLRDFDIITSSVKQSLAISHQHFSDKGFSRDIALDCDCDTYPVLRIVPDLVQKLEEVFEISQDWLRSDKVYLEQVQKEIGKVGEKVREVDSQSQLVRLEYDRMFSLLKQKQAEMDDNDETYDNLWQRISKLDVIKAKIDKEISAVARTLRNYQDQIEELNSADLSDGCADEDSDDEDCSESDDDSDSERDSRRRAHISYKSRLCKEARVHATKLEYLRKKKSRVEKKIAQIRDFIEELESNESVIKHVGKKLRSLGKKKAKLSEESVTLKAHLDALRLTLDTRLHPSRRPSSGISLRPLSGCGRRNRPSRKPSGGVSRPSSRNSADLNRAFRVVKNGIGHGWKDLIRVLPFSPEIPSAEINNEIRVIEYENQGQLKEQAYQAMAKWHNHNGRRASVELLKDSLREISENRLADDLEKNILHRQLSVNPSACGQ